MGKARITITIDESLLERIKDLAEQSGRKYSTLIEHLLSQAIVEEELMSPKYRGALFEAMGASRPLDTLFSCLRKAGMGQEQIDTLRRQIDRIPLSRHLQSWPGKRGT